MLNVFKVENFKMRKFTPFYVCMIVLVILIVGMVFKGLKQEVIDYCGYSCMHDGFVDSVQDCSLSFLFGMLISWYVGIDFTNRTIHRHIVTGVKRWKIVISEILATSVLTTIFHLTLVIGTVIQYGKFFGFTTEGFGISDLAWLGTILLQFAAYNSFFVLVAFLCENVYASTIIGVVVSSIGGNILRNFLRGNYIYEHSFFCFAKSSSSSDLIPCVICAIISIAVLFGITVIVFNKRDISS